MTRSIPEQRLIVRMALHAPTECLRLAQRFREEGFTDDAHELETEVDYWKPFQPEPPRKPIITDAEWRAVLDEVRDMDEVSEERAA